MTHLLVVGATAASVRQITTLASARGLRVVVDRAPRRPAWVIVATSAQRQDALARYGLPAFRVIEVPGIERDGAVDADMLSRGMARMAELGAYRPTAAAFALAVTRRLLPWVGAALERASADGMPDVEKAATLRAEKAAERSAERAAAKAADKAARKAALSAKRAPKIESPAPGSPRTP